MKKNKVIMGSSIVVMAILLLTIITPIKEVNRELALAVKNNNDTKLIQYGMNHQYLKETSPKYDALSMTIDLDEQLSQEIFNIPEETKHVQIILESSAEEVDKDKIQQLQEILLEVDREKLFYINIRYQEVVKQSEKLSDYAYMEQLFQQSNVKILYDASLYEAYESLNNIEYLVVDIKGQEDITTLKVLQNRLNKENLQGINIVVNDYIVAHNEDLTTILDLIYHLYYDIALYVPSVTWINQQVNLGVEDTRIAEAYETLLNNEWIVRQKEIIEGEQQPYRWVNAEHLLELEGAIEYVLPLQEEVEYVDYKLNGESLGLVFRYPYVVSLEANQLEHVYNELRVIVKFLDKEEVVTENIYFRVNKENNEGEEKSPRTTPNYTIENQMIYTQAYIPVLMYHEFKDEVGEGEESIAVETALFEAQIVKLLDEGYTPITFLDLKHYFDGTGGLPNQPVIITTDDGYLSNYLITYPILKKYNVPATYFVTSAYVGVMTSMPHFTWEEALEMEQSGLVDIQSHTHTHPAMNQLSEAAVKYQVGHSFEQIEKYLGERDVYALSYPQFLHSEDTIGWLDEMGVDFQNTNLNKGNQVSNPLDMKRIHVSNETTPDDLIEEIERLTMQ